MESLLGYTWKGAAASYQRETIVQWLSSEHGRVGFRSFLCVTLIEVFVSLCLLLSKSLFFPSLQRNDKVTCIVMCSVVTVIVENGYIYIASRASRGDH